MRSRGTEDDGRLTVRTRTHHHHHHHRYYYRRSCVQRVCLRVCARLRRPYLQAADIIIIIIIIIISPG
jgi:hypothetical protein